MIYIAYQNKKFRSQIEYIFDLILSIYEIEYKTVDYSQLSSLKNSVLIISYGKERPNLTFKYHIHIYESTLFGNNYLKPESMPERPLKRYNNLPIIYQGIKGIENHIKHSDNSIETDIDIIASSFFMLSRYEEVVLDKKDEFGCFPAKESLAYQENFLDRPIVNEYIELLWNWIDSFHLGYRRKSLWGDKDFSVCLTHDVDILKKYRFYPPLRKMASLLLKYRNAKKSFAAAIDYLKAKIGKDPYDKFGYIMDSEDKYHFRSSFYFMANGDSELDANYKIGEKKVIDLIGKIEKRGNEVGLHLSFDSYNNLEKAESEKVRLDKIVKEKYGSRVHYLRWIPETWRIQEKIGLLYDTTLTFADHAGFRCGICLPYKPYDVIENQRFDIWELPLIVMEASFQELSHWSFSPNQGYEEIVKYIETVKKFNGLFVILWHNSRLDELQFPGWAQTYRKTMEYIAQQNVFNDTGKGIINYWKNKNVQGKVVN